MSPGPNDSTRIDPKADDALAHDIAMTMELARKAFDGHQLSDEELDNLCDALLAEAPPGSPRTRREDSKALKDRADTSATASDVDPKPLRDT